MPYFINPIEDEKCIFLTCEGEMLPAEAVAIRYEAIGLLAAKGWNRIVVDGTELKSVSTALESFEFARELSSELPRSARIALVVRPEQARPAELARKTVPYEGALLSVFSDPEFAAAWVKAPRPHERTEYQPNGIVP